MRFLFLEQGISNTACHTEAEEKAAEKTLGVATQPQVQNPKFGQASEVITSSEDEYEDEEVVVDTPLEPAPQRQESTEPSSLVSEWLATTPDLSSKTVSGSNTPSASGESQPFPPLGLGDVHHQNDLMDIDVPTPPPQLPVGLKPADWPSTNSQGQTQSTVLSHNKLSTRSLSPSLGPLGGESQLVQRSHSLPEDRTRPGLVLDTALSRSYLVNRGDASASEGDIGESLVENQPHAPVLSGEEMQTTEHRIPACNTVSSRESSPLSSVPDSPTMQLLGMMNFSPALQSPSIPEPADPPTFPTTESCFEPRTSPGHEMEVQASNLLHVVAPSLQPAPTNPVEPFSNPSVTTKIPRVRHGATKRRILVVGSREERDTLVALYVQEAGELKTVKTALSYLCNRIGLVKGVQETERLLRLLGQAEDDGEVTLRAIHRKRVRELKQRDAKDRGLASPTVEDTVEGGAVELGTDENDENSDVPMMDVGEKVNLDSGDNLRHQIAAKEEHIEDIIYVCMGLFTRQQPLARATKVGSSTAENTLEPWALHTCAKCRVGQGR
ncbi:hypothetical protein QBC41DRAFT_356072 [Cercophora samala]|uniref:Uncharacterized protein n=1 Tax=Cercophora samala TaxID=330535 RepID=A0AA39ZEN8_9PEZI|nr:hypothetical protein QBC41DRAFT_356072 [Cercophora samala]